MRSVGFGLALLASVQFSVMPAFAADPSPSADQQSPAKSAAAKKKKKKPVKATTAATVEVRTTAGEVPAPAPAPAPSSTPAPAPDAATPAPAAAAPAPGAPSAGAAAGAAAPAAPAAAVNPPGTVTVHINSPKPVTLEKRSSATSPWLHVCNSPCDIATSTSDEYQIVGVDLNGSTPFVIDASLGDKITLDVTPGIHNKAVSGSWLLAGAGVLAVGGVVTLVAGSKSNYVAGDNGVAGSTSNTDWILVGSVLLVAGVVAGITGGSFMYDNAHTRVEGAIGAVPDRKTDVKAQVQVTAQRLPQWHEDAGPRLAPSRFVSVLNGTF